MYIKDARAQLDLRIDARVGPVVASLACDRLDWRTGSFLALDFETAGRDRASVCSVGLAWWNRSELTVESHLVHCAGPFEFTQVHGLTAESVRHAPTFDRVWRSIDERLCGVDFLVAHNAGFDASVLRAACSAHGVLPPRHTFVCTMRLARSRWNLYPTRLPDVCRWLGIALDHHDAASDAHAAAQILLRARATAAGSAG